MNAWLCSTNLSDRRQRVLLPPALVRVRPLPSAAGLILSSLLFVPLFLSSCAKTGDPQPPLVRVPRPSVDLSALQQGDDVVLIVSMPRENTDGSPAVPPSEIELFRLAQEDRRDRGEIPENDFLARAEQIFDVSGDLSAVISRERLVFRDSLPSGDRAAVYQRAYRYAVRFINSRNQTAGLGNQAVIAPVPVPAPPAEVSSEVTQDFIRLHWSPPQGNADGSRPARVAGYKLYRSEDPNFLSPEPLHDGLLLEPEFEDRSFQFGQTYYYAVSVIASAENPYAESRASTRHAVSPTDRFPPPAPVDLQAVVDRGVVLLLWLAPDAPDVSGYRIYRTDKAGIRVLLHSDLVSALSFRDEKAEAGISWLYGVAAVDIHGNEGPPAEVSIDIPR